MFSAMIVVTTRSGKESGEITYSTQTDSRWNAMSSTKIHRQRSNNQSTMPERHHKSIKIPAVHNQQDSGDGEYIRRKLRQEYNRSSRSLDRSEANKKSRSSRSLDRSEAGKTKNRKSRSCDRQGQTQHQHDQPQRCGRRTRKQVQSSRDVTLTKSKSSHLDKYPMSPGNRSLTETNRSYSSSHTSSSTRSGRKEPAQRGIQRSKSSRIEKDEPMSPGGRSRSSKSTYSTFSERSPLRRVRKTRSLDASTRSLPRDEYILTRSGHKRSVEREHSESEASLTDTTLSTSYSSCSSLTQPQKSHRKITESNPARSPSYRMRSKSNSDLSKLSTSTRSTTSLSSHTCSTPLSRSGRVVVGANSNIITPTPTIVSPEGLKRVSWKADPKTSFSDWVLHVTYRDSNNKRRIDKYNLHKNIVAYGTRKSNSVFQDIMDNELKEKFDSNNDAECEIKNLLAQGSNKQGEEQNVTKLKLCNETQAQAVPLVLDFMYYNNETNHRMSAERSCNVFKVAEGLKVRALQNAIGEFYEANLSLKNMGEFLKAATNAKADMLMAICKAKIRKMIAREPELAEKVPEEFLPDILDSSCHSYRSSLLDKSHRSGSKKKKQVFKYDTTCISPTPSRSDIDEFSP